MTSTPPPTTIDLPPFVCIASLEGRVLAYGRASTEDDAYAWCKRAQGEFLEHADQIALTTPVEADWFGIGRSITLRFGTAWTRAGSTWQTAERTTVRLNFDDLPSSPTPTEDLRRPDRPSSGERGLTGDHEIRFVTRSLVRLARGLLALAHVAQIATRSGRKVLLVSSSGPERRAVREALAAAHETAEAKSYSDALMELSHADFDAVVTTQQLSSVGSGLELLQEVRERWPRVRRVLSAQTVDEIEAAVACGAAQHVLKGPLDASAVTALLSTL